MKHEADELPLNETKKYDAMMAEIDAVRQQALPYVEKAHELLPEDEAIKLERKLSKNYRIERVFLDELASKGFHIVGDLNDD